MTAEAQQGSSIGRGSFLKFLAFGFLLGTGTLAAQEMNRKLGYPVKPINLPHPSLIQPSHYIQEISRALDMISSFPSLTRPKYRIGSGKGFPPGYSNMVSSRRDLESLLQEYGIMEI